MRVLRARSAWHVADGGALCHLGDQRSHDRSAQAQSQLHTHTHTLTHTHTHMHAQDQAATQALVSQAESVCQNSVTASRITAACRLLCHASSRDQNESRASDELDACAAERDTSVPSNTPQRHWGCDRGAQVVGVSNEAPVGPLSPLLCAFLRFSEVSAQFKLF